MKNKIISFWNCSIDETMDKFDFERFLSEFEEKLIAKLSGHGQLSFDDYIKFLNKYYDVEILREFEYISKHTGYKQTYEDILHAIFDERYKMFNKRFSKSEIYKNIINIFKELKDREHLTRRDKIFLVDKCIDLQHHSGFVIDVDITKLKKEFEQNEKRKRKNNM